MISVADAGTRLLRDTFAGFPSGVVAVCAARDGVSDGRPDGMAASSFTSVSIGPPLVSVCVQTTSSTWPRLREFPRLGVSVLADEHDVACRQLASSGDRFAGLTYEQTPDGAVLLRGSAAWLDCSVETEIVAGDHIIVLLRIEAVELFPLVSPLVFHASAFRRLAVAG